VDAVLEPVVEVGVDIAIVDRREAVAAFEDSLDRPTTGGPAPGFRGRMMIVFSCPTLGDRDRRVWVDRVVALEV